MSMRRTPLLRLEQNGQTDGLTDGCQSVTLRLPLDAAIVIKMRINDDLFVIEQTYNIT